MSRTINPEGQARRRTAKAPNLDAKRLPAATLHRFILDRMAELPTATPKLDEVAAAVGWEVDRMRARVELMADHGIVETWRDADAVRVLISAKSADALGLVLSRRGDRWVGAAG